MLSKFLQNQEQMRLNIGKKLKTASLNPRFTGSKKKVYFDHRRSQGGAQGARAPLNQNTTNDKSYDNIAWRCLVAVFFQYLRT